MVNKLHPKQRQPAKRGPGARRWLVWFGVTAAAALFVAMIVVAAGRPRLPRVGDHWHAQYRIVVCGAVLPQLPYTSGGIHTHGDGLMHIHPERPGESGRNATVGRFLASGGITLRAGGIEFPDGKVFRNGGRCPDSTPGVVRVLVNGRPSEALERYVPHDGDTIVIEFGPG